MKYTWHLTLFQSTRNRTYQTVFPLYKESFVKNHTINIEIISENLVDYSFFFFLFCMILCKSHFSLIFVFEIKSDFTQKNSCIQKSRFEPRVPFHRISFFRFKFVFRHIVSLINECSQHKNKNPNETLIRIFMRSYTDGSARERKNDDNGQWF